MNLIHRWTGGIALMAVCTGLTTGCETMNNNRTATGAVAGGLLGATAGALIDGDNPWRGGAIGAVAGTALGGGIGYVLQKQKEAFDRIEYLESRPATVNYTPPPPPPIPNQPPPPPPPPVRRDALILTIPNEVLFDVGSSALSPRGAAKAREIANVLRDNPDSQVIVRGYASSEGEDYANFQLSERRAQAVSNELIASGVSSGRVVSQGMGESDPIADNNTEAGRRANRRVEIMVIPNEQVR